MLGFGLPARFVGTGPQPHGTGIAQNLARCRVGPQMSFHAIGNICEVAKQRALMSDANVGIQRVERTFVANRRQEILDMVPQAVRRASVFLHQLVAAVEEPVGAVVIDFNGPPLP